jgi:hypothetical protein
MSKFRALTFLCTCAFAFVFGVSVQSAEPTFQHQNLNRWLQLYQSAKPGSAKEARCVAAIRCIGTNAMPQLIARLTTSHLKTQQEAVTTFDILGPLGAPAIPALMKLFNDTNPIVTIFNFQ